MKQSYVETIKETTATMTGDIYPNNTLPVPKGTALIYVPNAGDCSGYAIKDPVGLGFDKHDSIYRYAYLPKNNRAVYHVRYVSGPVSSKGEDWRDTKHKWSVDIAGQKFDFYTGKDTPPKYDEVMECLISDSTALYMTFEEFADEFGYSSDSIEAKNIWQECCDIARKLLKTGIDIEAERIRLTGE